MSFKIKTGGGKATDGDAGAGAKVLRMPPRQAPPVEPTPARTTAADIAAAPEMEELKALLDEPPTPIALPQLPPPPPLTPGIYLDVSHDRYHADPAERPSLSSSIAQIIVEQNAFKAWHKHPRLGKPTNGAGTSAMNTGTILHKLLLGIGQDVALVDAKDFKTKAAQLERDAAIAAGQVPVIKSKFEGLQVLAEQLRKRMKAKGIHLAGESEVSAIWERDGVLCRCRFDHWTPDEVVIDDIKTTTNASPEKFTTKMIEYGYDIQHAAYIEAIETLIPELVGRVRMRFVVCEVNEDDPANEVSVIEPDGTMRELGQRRWRRAKGIWQQSLAAGVDEQSWPGYSAGVVRVGAPTWALSREMETQTNRMENDNANAEF